MICWQVLDTLVQNLGNSKLRVLYEILRPDVFTVRMVVGEIQGRFGWVPHVNFEDWVYCIGRNLGLSDARAFLHSWGIRYFLELLRKYGFKAIPIAGKIITAWEFHKCMEERADRRLLMASGQRVCNYKPSPCMPRRASVARQST